MKEPKIRFKGFQGEWETSIIGDIATFSKGRGYSKSDLRSEGNPIVLYGRLYTNYASVIESVDTFASLQNGSVITKGNEVIIPGSGETPEDIAIASAVEQKGVILGGDINVLSFDQDKIVPTFAAMSITNSKTHYELSGYAQGKTVVHLHNSSISRGHISYPYIDEQRAIASYFQHLDALIQSTTKKIESLKQVKAASLQSMFPQEGETTPRVRFKGFEREWEKVLIGKMGVTYSGLSGKTKDDFGFGEARFITFLNVLTNAKIDTSILEPVNVNRDEHQNEVRKGDLLFNTSSETPEEVGMCGVMDEQLENVYLNSFCFGFRVTDNNIDPTCVAYVMRSHIGRRIMSILAQGATRYNLSKNSFCKAVLVLPKNIAEQRAIASYFTNLDRQITLHTQRLEKLKQIKAACLDEMFV